MAEEAQVAALVVTPNLGIASTVNLFLVFYKLSKQRHWFSFEKRVSKGAGEKSDNQREVEVEDEKVLAAKEKKTVQAARVAAKKKEKKRADEGEGSSKPKSKRKKNQIVRKGYTASSWFGSQNAPKVKNKVVHVSSHESADEYVHNYIDVDNNRQRDETPRIEPFVNPADQTLQTNFEEVFADESTLLVLFDRRHVEKGKSFGAVYVPQWAVLGICRVDSSMWCQEMMVHLAPSVKIDDPNITKEEYIRLEEEKAYRRGKVFNRETAKYGKIWYDEDVHDTRSIETKFPAIVFKDNLTSNKTPSCEPMVSSLNDEIDFRILFYDSDDEDYTVIFDKNLFSYKISSTNDLKMNSENNNEKFMLSLPSPEPIVSCFDDLDFFKDFENEFPAIVHNDAQTSKSDLLTKPILSPQHIDEVDDKKSLSECDEEEQNILKFNDLFPFNVIYPNVLISDKDNDDDKVDIEHSSGDLSVKLLPDVINTDVGAYALMDVIHFPNQEFVCSIWHIDPKLFYKDEIKLVQV
nr:hypothetical protein [Tanacetum cinerariifolium]